MGRGRGRDLHGIVDCRIKRRPREQWPAGVNESAAAAACCLRFLLACSQSVVPVDHTLADVGPPGSLDKYGSRGRTNNKPNP